MRELDYSAKKLFELRGRMLAQPFAAIDPGAEGALAIYPRPQLKPDAVYPLAVPRRTLLNALVLAGVRLIFVEAQHTRMNNATALTLARRAGYIGAALDGYYAGCGQDVEVLQVWLHPATWQQYMLAHMEGRRGRLEEGEGKTLAMKHAERIMGGDGRWVGATKKQRQGIADTLMIGAWAGASFW